MKILLAGGGTGGHFYPIIAVAASLKKIVKEEKFVDAQIYYMAPSPYDARLLFENDIAFKRSYAGKMRRYFSIKNVFDYVKTGVGVIKAVVNVWSIYPDVVFGKGGYASFPPLLAAKLLRIPVVIHESDSKPGRVNAWAGKFAKRIAVSYESAAKYFPAGKVAHTGNPVRAEIMDPITAEPGKFFGLEGSEPAILILGGSQGSQRINESIIDILPDLVEDYAVIHQTGKTNFKEVSETVDVVLKDNPRRSRYKPLAYLSVLALRMAAGASSIVISRAGSQIFEIALWKKPSIIIPIPEEVSHDQTSNAFAYAATGACSVIEESNLTPHVLLAEIRRILENQQISSKMVAATDTFAIRDAADKIAQEIINIALSHES
jgi:UDP-N-acetylglucosamine--N-acetylmuramyl-(pentapeptide) pyrophosphoryl-undecaprenol N-acetylglucosamine transferase